MKIILLLGSLLASSSYFYFMGHADGYREAQHDAYPNLNLRSNCYTPQDVFVSPDAVPCVTLDEPTDQSKENL